MIKLFIMALQEFDEKLTLYTKGDFYSNHVFEITGEYTGSRGAVGPTHERGD